MLPVKLEAGQTTELQLELALADEHAGWVSVDPHVHASPSLDGECTVEERLVTVVANDLMVHVATDHDHIADYRPAAGAMGLDAWAITVPGDEISPNVRGHHNIYPVEPVAGEPNGGAPRWWEDAVSTSELYAAWRDQIGDDAVLQVNHGRDSSGMFAAADYDPDSGEAGDPDYFGTAFDTMEILNSKGFGAAELLLEDWCSLLDQGLRPVAVGVSDSHTRLSGPGFPRTLVKLDVDSVTDEIVPELIEALKAGHAQVSAGPVFSFEASDGSTTVGMGETIEASSLTLSIELRAASWIPVDSVTLYGPGCQVQETWTVDAAKHQAPVQFTTTVEIEQEEDGYWFVLAKGDGMVTLEPAWGGLPYALTNPVFVEVP